MLTSWRFPLFTLLRLFTPQQSDPPSNFQPLEKERRKSPSHWRKKAFSQVALAYSTLKHSPWNDNSSWRPVSGSPFQREPEHCLRRRQRTEWDSLADCQTWVQLSEDKETWIGKRAKVFAARVQFPELFDYPSLAESVYITTNEYRTYKVMCTQPKGDNLQHNLHFTGGSFFLFNQAFMNLAEFFLWCIVDDDESFPHRKGEDEIRDLE